MLISIRPENYKDVTVEQPLFERILIPAKIISAAKIFQAKDDMRYYLNGIHFDPRGYVEATNGHYAIRIECEECKRLPKKMILDIKGAKIPAKAKDLEFVSMGTKSGVILMRGIQTYRNFKSPIILDDVRSFKLINGVFPELDRMMPKSEHLEAVEMIGINANYMKDIAEAQRILNGSRAFSGIEMLFRGESSIIEINIPSPFYKAKVLLMPMKV